MNRNAENALRVAKAIFMPLAFAFLAFALYQSKGIMAQLAASATMEMVAVSAAIWGLSLLAAPLVSWRILSGLGFETRYGTLLSIHMGRLPAKYLPGGVWHTVGRVVDLGTLGADRKTLLGLVYFENLTPLGVAVLAGCLCLLAEGETRSFVPALAATALAGTVCAPLALRRIIVGLPPLPLRRYLGILAATALFWVIASASFVAYLMALAPAGFDFPPLRVVGTYLLSWAGGFVVLFAPQGLGVFEAIASLLLEAALPFATMALVVAGFRVCALAGELGGYLFFLLLRLARSSRPD